MNNLTNTQLELEKEAVSIGVEKYREQVNNGRNAELPPGLRLIRNAVEPIALKIEADKKSALEGKADRGTTMFYFLDQFDSDMLAYVTAKLVMSHMGQVPLLSALAIVVAKTLEDSLNYESLKKEAPALYRSMMRKLAKHNNSNYRHVILRRTQNYAKVTTIKWDKNNSLKLGVYLIETLINETGYVSKGVRHTGKGYIHTLHATPEILKWIEEGHSRCEMLHPTHLPMIIKPLPWSTPFDGGFLTKQLKYTLIKTANKNYLSDLEHHPMPMVYRAVNALQDTAWSVNKPVLKIMKQVWAAGDKLGGLPSRELTELPPKGHDPETDKVAHKEWKKEAAAVYDSNTRSKSKRVLTAQKLNVADKYSEFAQFYFPYALDWRGRAYPVSSVLNPQGDDTAKALLTFAQSKPLGVNGQYWLYVHGSNCFGVDKVAFSERVSWVEDHHNHILESAFNPLDGSRFWADADSPYMFLAFCYEYAALFMHTSAGESDETFESNLPVSWDGSCNGLQNFSAMLRDEKGGKATNLTPSETPSDIYAEVARVCQESIDKEALGGDLMAKKWVGRVTRKLVKRNTMTVPYAVSKFGMKQQLLEEFKKMKEEALDIGMNLDKDLTWDDAAFLAEHNHAAIGQVVVAARDAMGWLREAAKVAASNGLPVQWVTPSGLLALQNYRKSTGKRADFELGGKRYSFMLRVEGEKIDTRKQSLGIAPNVVHSLDAAHMMRTVSYCLDEGITSFAMIHDSYGTHAADAEALSRLLREAFIDQYTPDVLADFKNQLAMQLPEEIAEKIPELPPMGTLDLSGVRDSSYFFA